MEPGVDKCEDGSLRSNIAKGNGGQGKRTRSEGEGGKKREAG